jgi:hypothetical protein
MDATTIVYRLTVRLVHLRNLFFLDRLLLRRDHYGVEDLIGVSFEMVSLVVGLWTRMDRLIYVRDDLPWTVSIPTFRTLLQLTC